MQTKLKESYTREELKFSNLISIIMKDSYDTAQGDSIYWHSKSGNQLIEIDFENRCVNYSVDEDSNMKNKRYYMVVGICATHRYEFIEVVD